MKGRKAVSPIVATMLLIAIVVAAAASVALLVNYYINKGSSIYDVSLSEDKFYDFDGDGKADLAVFDLTTKTVNSVPIANVSVIFSNGVFVGDSWWSLPLTSDSISASEPGKLVITAGKSSEQFSIGDSYTLIFSMAGGNAKLTGSVTEINPTDPLTFQLQDSTVISATLRMQLEMAASRNEPDAVELLQAGGRKLKGIKVVPFDARKDLPASVEKVTDDNGKASFRLRAGKYYLKIYISPTDVKKTAVFTHPARLDNFKLFRKVPIKSQIQAVNVHYSENDVPVDGATIYSYKKVIVNNKVVEQVTGISKTTNINGSATFYLLNGEYKFNAYHGSTVPASSSFVDVSQTKDVYINTNPGVVYVKVLQQNNVGISSAFVRAYSVIGSSATYVGYKYTNATGYAAFSIPASEFKIQVTKGKTYNSGIFKVVPGSVYEFYLDGNHLSVNVTTSSGDPVSSIYVSLYDEFGRALSSQRTNNTGFADFYGLKNGSYYLKYYAGSSYHSTSKFSVNSDLVYNITIQGLVIYANVTNPNGSPRQNQYVYLMSSKDNKYLGFARTNTSGIATFITTVSENTSVYLRTYFYISGKYTQARSLSFNATNGMVVQFKLGGTLVEVHVQDNSGNPIKYTRVNAYLNGEIYVTQYLNANGNATFALLPNTNYTIGIDYGTIIQTAVFNTSITTSVLLVVNVVPFTIHVKNSDGTNLANARVYLYAATSGWVYLGYSTTDSNGKANFNAPESGMYRVYVYSYSPYLYFYSSNFTITNGGTVVVQPASTTIRLMTTSGQPLKNSYFYLYTLQNSYAGWGKTNSTGYATVTISNGSTYKIRMGSLYSKPITLVENTVNTVLFDLVTIYVKLVDSNGNGFQPPNSWTYTYIYFNSNNSYIGYGVFNSSGIATVLAPNNTELVARLYLSGREILSSPFNSSDGLVTTIVVIGHQLTVRILNNGSALQNAYVYLYSSELGTYSGWAKTNTTGYAVFSFVINDSYYLRIYKYPVVSQKSSTFNVTGNTLFEYSLATTTVSVSVYQIDSTSKVGADQWVYLRTTEGYWGGWAKTNASGVAVLNAVVNASYLAYSYYPGKGYVYSNLFNATANKNVEIHPVPIYIRVLDGANNTVPQMRVYLSYQGIQAGYGYTNSSGVATVYANNQSKYVLVVTKAYFTYGQSYIGGQITAKSGDIHEVNIGGGTVYVKLIDYDGTPLTSAYVYLYLPSGNGYYQWTGYYAITNSSGIATFLGVGDGTYVAYSYQLGIYSSEFQAQHGLVVTIDGSAVLNISTEFYMVDNPVKKTPVQ